MITWAKVILAILRLVEIIYDEAQKKGWIDEGEKQAIAKAQAESLRKNDYAKKILSETEQLSDSQLDDKLRDLADGK